MNNYSMLIQYDGWQYNGWQRLDSGENTVQGKLEKVLSKLAEDQIEIIGSNRTDTGVHALAQIANFKTNAKLTANNITSGSKKRKWVYSLCT